MRKLPPHLERCLDDPERFVRAVFAERLRVVTDAPRLFVQLPERSQHYLAEVGLPVGDEILTECLGLSFNLATELPLVADLPGFRDVQDARLLNRLVLDVNDGTVTVIDVANGGSVRVFGKGIQVAGLFLNGNVESLGTVLAMYVATSRVMRALPLEASGCFNEDLEHCIRHVDPSALSSGDNFWPTVLGEMEYGML